jgi:hypothetical protein
VSPCSWISLKKSHEFLFCSLQLSAVIDRLLAMPVSAPLKAMLTGVELLLAKAQVRPASFCTFLCICQAPACSIDLKFSRDRARPVVALRKKVSIGLGTIAQPSKPDQTWPPHPATPPTCPLMPAAVGGDCRPPRVTGTTAGTDVGPGHPLEAAGAGCLARPAGHRPGAGGGGGTPGWFFAQAD